MVRNNGISPAALKGPLPGFLDSCNSTSTVRRLLCVLRQSKPFLFMGKCNWGVGNSSNCDFIDLGKLFGAPSLFERKSSYFFKKIDGKIPLQFAFLAASLYRFWNAKNRGTPPIFLLPGIHFSFTVHGVIHRSEFFSCHHGPKQAAESSNLQSLQQKSAGSTINLYTFQNKNRFKIILESSWIWIRGEQLSWLTYPFYRHEAG